MPDSRVGEMPDVVRLLANLRFGLHSLIPAESLAAIGLVFSYFEGTDGSQYDQVTRFSGSMLTGMGMILLVRLLNPLDTG